MLPLTNERDEVEHLIKKYRKMILAGLLTLCFFGQCMAVGAAPVEAVSKETKLARESAQDAQTAMQSDMQNDIHHVVSEEENQEKDSSQETSSKDNTLADEMTEDAPSEDEISGDEEGEKNGTEESYLEDEVSTDTVQEKAVLEGETSENALSEGADSEAELPTRPLSEVEQEMDAALSPPSTAKVTRQAAGAGRAASGEPTASITKTAQWVDIERGIARIDLTETDTPGATNQGMDYIIILDRTRTMSLNDRNFQGNESDHVGASNSPCLNRDHYYEYDGKQLDLYDYTSGLIRGTNTVVTLPQDAGLYRYHKNGAGQSIGVDYGNGCQDRLSLSKQTICGLIDRIAANSPKAAVVGNRVSYWSFAGTYWPEQEGELDTDPEKGIYNYIPLTGDFAAVKNKVNETMTYAGTYYQESMKRAYEQLSARTGNHKNAPSKVIFISDGKCSDDWDQVTYWNEKLRQIPGCTIYTLAVGMPVASDGAVFLKNLSTNRDSSTFAAFTTNLNTSNPAFANTLAAIEAATVKTSAVKKVLTDKLQTKYWNFDKVLSVDGSAQCKDGVLTWQVPDGENRTWRCSIQVRLKDAYRYLVSDTSYDTNADTAQEKGCRLDYEISGGASNGQKRKTEAATPVLKYGAVEVKGIKKWAVKNAEGEGVLFRLGRRLPGAGQDTWLAEQEVTAVNGWQYVFQTRLEGAEQLPLVLYNNAQQKYTYALKEEVPFYENTNVTRQENGGKLEVTLENTPYRIRLQVEKKAADTKEPLDGASFGVYVYSKKTQDYEPYTGDDTSASGKTHMQLIPKQGEKGVYVTPAWLYYTPDNDGRFRVVEERAPEGFVGDYTDDTYQEKHTYDVRITEENTGTEVAKTVDGAALCVENEPVKGEICVYKRDADSGLGAPQGNAKLFYEDTQKNARYGLFDAAGEQVADGRIGSDGKLTFADVPLGTYTVRELDTPPEGYLLDDTAYPVTLLWEGEDKPLVKVQLEVSEPVKKQKQVIYKVGGDDDATVMEWIKDAGFMVFSYQDLELYEQTENGRAPLSDEQVRAILKEKYQNPKNLTYTIMKTLPGVLLFETGSPYRLEEFYGKDGILETPLLPYGDYVLVETTVPKGKRSVELVLLHIREDETDGEKKGDGKGTKREPIILRDRDVKANVQIIKKDAVSGLPVQDGEAAYVIHDVEGAWRKQYFAKATLAEKAAYLLRGDGLVLEYDQATGSWRGTRSNPYRTQRVQTDALAAFTKEGLPEGLYELEEVTAPAGYVLSGQEGVISRSDAVTTGNHTYYETEAAGQWTPAGKARARFVVTADNAAYDAAANRWTVTAEQYNDPVIGKLSIVAMAEKTEPNIRVPQKGAAFALYAEEDIRDGSGRLLYEKDALVRTFVADAKGQAWSGDTDGTDGNPAGLPMGTYRLVQTKAGEGFALDEAATRPRIITFSYKDSHTPVIYRDESYLLLAEKKTVELPEKERPSVPQPAPASNPKTGDVARPEALAFLGLCSLAIIIRRRKNR